MAHVDKKTILLTGATGNMGSATLAELLSRTDRMQVRALVRAEERAHPVVQRYEGHPGLQFVWGDLTRYEDVIEAVTGVDQVLHIGGLVSPMADHVPELTMKVNVGGARNIVEAIKAQPDPDRIALVYIGTVAQTGHRNPPVHWGRTGDPIKISRFDQYAVSKTMAEAIVAQSGIKRWVSLRQTGIAHPNMWKIFDPIIFHNPWNGVLEWVTVGDSGRLAANTCEDAVPESFWRGFYNIGGGQAMRVVNHEFATLTASALGARAPFSNYRPNWFATRNFHGQWYADSDRLEALVPFRRETLDDFAAGLSKAVPGYVKFVARHLPGLGRKRLEKLARGPGGTLHWLAQDDRPHIEAYFGSRAAWEALPTDWENFQLRQPSREVMLLDHGYAADADVSGWSASDYAQAAEFRGAVHLGGGCGADEPTSWRCALGHDFTMTPRLYLKGGHWCPTCMLDQDAYGRNAEVNPFFKQVWPDTD
ncbi:NAD-dependent epimerase/dehydratase family protein [Novosphingobium sp. BL-8H]|uniref:NAD-dependent epimerase/dehydratase family protein n=1 Tax=Novosphingobium sp. BL-8H TaxID=3127640 RepID=UPI0037572BBD